MMIIAANIPNEKKAKPNLAWSILLLSRSLLANSTDSIKSNEKPDILGRYPKAKKTEAIRKRKPGVDNINPPSKDKSCFSKVSGIKNLINPK